MAELVALQMVSVPDVDSNLTFVEQQLQNLKPTEPTLVLLPECFACFGASDRDIAAVSEVRGDGPIQSALSRLASQYGVWLAGGSIPIRSIEEGRYTASCLLYNDKGELQAEYQKIHLFDVNVGDNTGRYLESRYTDPGDQVVVVDDTPFGRIGLSICYDVRFAGLYQAMGEVDIILVPAAFTEKTGRAHWHSLLRARAIENQCYLLAANQGGVHANGRETYGHSCLISPWGDILTEIPSAEGVIRATMEPSLIAKVRASMPVHQHNKFRSELV